MMYLREETEYYRAKMKAAKAVHKGWVKPADLPSNAEIRDQVQAFAMVHEGSRQTETLREMRIEALRMMRMLRRFHPRLIGSVLTGHIRHGSDIDLHCFCDSVESIRGELEFHGIANKLEEKRIVKSGERQLYRHIYIHDRFKFELTVYPTNKLSHVFKSSITGKAIERMSIAEFEKFLVFEYDNIDLDYEIDQAEEKIDRFQLYASLLLPLENVKQNVQYHPEGDALYHSLQVFDLACDRLPYDEEFLLAALLHDVGKAINPYDHVNAGVDSLMGFITERTEWLIANHMLAHKIADKSIGARQHRRLRENESYDELVMLGECDREGRVCGVETTDLDDALEYIREISDSFQV